jgi:leucyl aminopeptidase
MESNQTWLKACSGKESGKTLVAFITEADFEPALKEHVGPQFSSAQF